MIDLAVVFQPNYVMGVPNHSGLYALETARNNIVQVLETRQIELGFPMGVGGAEVRGTLEQTIDSGLVGFDQLCSGSSASLTPKGNSNSIICHPLKIARLLVTHASMPNHTAL